MPSWTYVVSSSLPWRYTLCESTVAQKSLGHHPHTHQTAQQPACLSTHIDGGSRRPNGGTRQPGGKIRVGFASACTQTQTCCWPELCARENPDIDMPVLARNTLRCPQSLQHCEGAVFDLLLRTLECNQRRQPSRQDSSKTCTSDHGFGSTNTPTQSLLGDKCKLEAQLLPAWASRMESGMPFVLASPAGASF